MCELKLEMQFFNLEYSALRGTWACWLHLSLSKKILEMYAGSQALRYLLSIHVFHEVRKRSQYDLPDHFTTLASLVGPNEGYQFIG